MGGGASKSVVETPSGLSLLEQIGMKRRRGVAPDASGLLLPGDLLGRVFGKIQGSRVPLSAVCRTWEGIMCGTGGVVKEVTVRQPKKSSGAAASTLTATNLLGLLIRFEGLEGLTLQDGAGPGRYGYDPDVWGHLAAVLGRQMELRQIGFVNCSIGDEDFAASVLAAAGTLRQSKCPLKGLAVEGCDKLTAAGVCSVGRNLEKVSRLALRRLRLTNAQVREAIAAYKTLDHLELCGMDTLSSKVLGVEMGGLTSLDLSGNNWVDDRACEALGEACEMNLKEIRLCYCEQITPVGVGRLAARLTALRVVDLSECGQVDGDSIRKLGEKAKGMESLTLTGCKRIDNKALMDISATMPRLTRLAVSRCPRVLDMGVAAVGQRCLDLEYLDVSHCPKVSEASILPVLRREGSCIRGILVAGTEVDYGMIEKNSSPRLAALLTL